MSVPMDWLKQHASYAGDDCLRWPYRIHKRTGYGHVWSNNVNRCAHRAMLIEACGEQQGMHAAHSCGNRWCVNPKHLRWATASENQRDRVGHGTDGRGEKNHRAKLTRDQVMRIADMLVGEKSLQQIADEFAVTKQNVWMIQHGKAWGWLTGRTRGGDQNRAEQSA